MFLVKKIRVMSVFQSKQLQHFVWRVSGETRRNCISLRKLVTMERLSWCKYLHSMFINSSELVMLVWYWKKKNGTDCNRCVYRCQWRNIMKFMSSPLSLSLNLYPLSIIRILSDVFVLKNRIENSTHSYFE